MAIAKRRPTTLPRSPPRPISRWPSCIASWRSDLLASEKPKKLSADELEQYDLLLEEQATPFEEQAIKMHEANTVHARDGIYDDGVKASYAALAKLLPGRYGKTEIVGTWTNSLVLPQKPPPAPEPRRRLRGAPATPAPAAAAAAAARRAFSRAWCRSSTAP